MVLFADDTSIIVTGTNQSDFNVNTNQMFQDINTWFKDNLLTLNLNKTQYLEFRSKNYYNVDTLITCDQRCVDSTSETKFLGLSINETLSWKQHIEQMLIQMRSACYALRNIKHIDISLILMKCGVPRCYVF